MNPEINLVAHSEVPETLPPTIEFRYKYVDRYGSTIKEKTSNEWAVEQAPANAATLEGELQTPLGLYIIDGSPEKSRQILATIERYVAGRQNLEALKNSAENAQRQYEIEASRWARMGDNEAAFTAALNEKDRANNAYKQLRLEIKGIEQLINPYKVEDDK